MKKEGNKTAKEQKGKKFSIGRVVKWVAQIFLALLVVVLGVMGLYWLLAPNMEGGFTLPTYTSNDYLMDVVITDANLDPDTVLYLVFNEEGRWEYGYSEYEFNVKGALDAFGVVIPYQQIEQSFGGKYDWHENYGQRCYFSGDIFLDLDESLVFGVINTSSKDPSFEEWCQTQYVRDPITVWVVKVNETPEGLQVAYTTEEWDIRIAFDFLY